MIGVVLKMNNYKVDWDERRTSVRITDKRAGYSLFLVLNRDPVEFVHCSFDTRSRRCGFITSRDINEYDEGIRSLVIDPLRQYVEVGAGLGAFIPDIVKRFGDKLQYKPIIIDPAHYETMHGIIDYALAFGLEDGNMNNKLKTLAERCDTIHNPGKVRLINMTIGEAVKKHREILGMADVVVDNCGPVHYARNYQLVWNLERRMLKPSGRLISEVIKSGMHAVAN